MPVVCKSLCDLLTVKETAGIVMLSILEMDELMECVPRVPVIRISNSLAPVEKRHH